MNTRHILLLLTFSIVITSLQAKSSLMLQDSIIHPSTISIDAVFGFDNGTIYPNFFGKGTLRYEFRRKSSIGFATGITGSSQGSGVPVLLTMNLDKPKTVFQAAFGAIAQLGGQPFFFPTIEARIRFGPGRKGVFVDLIAYGHYRYVYDCPRASYTCSGPFYRVGWKMQGGIGFAIGFSKRKKA